MTAVSDPRDMRVGVAGTVMAHGTLVALVLVAAHRSHAPRSMTYEVSLVAAPLPTPQVHNAPPQAMPAVPKPTVPIVKTKVPKVHPAPLPPPPPVAHQQVDKTPVTQTPAKPAPGEAPSTGQDAATVHQLGLKFLYPEYLRQIENAIRQRWSYQSFKPGFDVQIEFVIAQDGTVPPGSVNIVVSSRNALFDENARSAIESASNQHAFGPLPSGFVGTLPILFDFAQVAKGTP
ncbi:MAG TPA: TonB C-terminal domain-containing protein [Gemmatimonadales bacterium]|jgi:outer membrane biosynthesis protein TonB